MSRGKWYSSPSDLRGQIIYTVFLIIMFGGLLLWRWETAKIRKSILKDPRFSVAVLTKISAGSSRQGHRTYFTYSFTTATGLQSRTNAYSTARSEIRLQPPSYPYLIGKTFPIIYSGKYPEKPRLLLLRRDFRRFNLAFPDSLRWTEPLLYARPSAVPRMVMQTRNAQ